MRLGASASVKVRLGGSLAQMTGADLYEVRLDEALTVAAAAALVGVSPDLVMLYCVNGTLRPPEHRPMAGDEVLLIPAVAGGAH
ncbi:MAG: MoaD/ThiS family protein [Chloroflexota bacterium]